MATGLQMFDALKLASRDLPAGIVFEVNPFDAKDLCKLTADDLRSRGFDAGDAERISSELLRTGQLNALGEALGIRLTVVKRVRDLIRGEGLRRSAGGLAGDGQTLEEALAELDRIRHSASPSP